jgi:hypothetical protein
MRNALLITVLATLVAGCGGEVRTTGSGASGGDGSSGTAGASGSAGSAGASGSNGTSGAAGSTGCTSPNPSILPAGMCQTQENCSPGSTCDLSSPGCKPSSCVCDPATNSWGCTDDCGLIGKCIPDGPCAGPNPQGCVQTGCPTGLTCVQLSGVCVSSSCTCDASTASWVCDPDCGGGACLPDTSSKACGGLGGVQCPPDEYCDYPTGGCGFDDGQGTCLPRPTNCTDPCTGICGCDGVAYCNECAANAAGSDRSISNICGE